MNLTELVCLFLCCIFFKKQNKNTKLFHMSYVLIKFGKKTGVCDQLRSFIGPVNQSIVYYSACQVKLEHELREKNDKTPERTTKKPKGRTIATSVAARTSKSSSHITAGDHGCTIRTGYQTGSMAAWQFFSSGHKRYCSKKNQQLTDQ